MQILLNMVDVKILFVISMFVYSQRDLKELNVLKHALTSTVSTAGINKARLTTTLTS